MKWCVLKKGKVSKSFFCVFLCGVCWIAQATVENGYFVPKSDKEGELNSSLTVVDKEELNSSLTAVDKEELNSSLMVGEGGELNPSLTLAKGENNTVVSDNKVAGSPKLKTSSDFMTITWEEKETCTNCNLFSLLKQPQLFFRSLELEDNSQTVDLKKYQNQQLSIKLFGVYSSDLKQEGDYILTVGMQRPTSLSDHLSNPDYSLNTKENIRAGYVGLIKSTTPFSYRVNVRVHDPMEYTGERDLAWSGSASYRIVQTSSHDVFLKGGVGSDTATYLMDPLRINSQLLSTVFFDDQVFQQNQDEEYLTYEVGFRIERDQDVFLDISAFETNITDKNKRGAGYVESVDPKQIVNIQGVEVRAGFLLESLEGEARYVYADSDETSFRGDQFVKHLGSLRLGYSLADKLFLGTVWTHTGGDVLDSTQPSIGVLDIYSFYNIDENTRYGVVLQNVTDETYEQNSLRYERGLLFKKRDRTLWLQLEFQQ